MTLELWVSNGWLQTHETSRSEISELLAVADRDLKDASIGALSSDARVKHAYSACLAASNVALSATGFRPVRERNHERLLDSLTHTIGADSRLIRQLHKYRKARNTMTYERIGTVTDKEAWDAVALARELTATVRRWLAENHASLVQEDK